MRRYTVFEGFDEETKFFITFFFRKSQYFENLRLKILVMDSDGTASQFHSVEYDIVGFRFHCSRIGIQQRNLLQLRLGKRMMHCFQFAGFIVLFEHWEIHNPKQFKFLIIQQPQTACDFSAQEAERIKDNLLSI